MPTNSDSDASAAASWMTALTMDSLPGTDREHSSCYVLMSRAAMAAAKPLRLKSTRRAGQGRAGVRAGLFRVALGFQPSQFAASRHPFIDVGLAGKAGN